MSIQDRRNATLKSSISINSIRDSATNFSLGLQQSQKEASQIINQQTQSNVFKRSLIREDGKFFARRRENVLRKEREDEIEASTLQGATKREGTILQKSTRGFLGRMLDLVGIVIIGWFTTKLLPILPKLAGLITLLIKLLSVGKFFTDAIATFIVNIEEGITKQFTKIPRRQELEQDQTNVVAGLEETNNRVQLLNMDFFRLTNEARKPGVFGLSNFGETDFYKERGFEVDDEGNMIVPPEEQGSEEQDKKLIEDGVDAIKISTEDINYENSSINDERNQNIESQEKDNKEVTVIKSEVDDKNQRGSGVRTSSQDSEDLTFNKKADEADNKVVKFFKNVFGYDTRTNKSLKESEEDAINRESENNIQGLFARFKYPKSDLSPDPDKRKQIERNFNREDRGEVVASIEITDEMKAGIIPNKKEVDVSVPRKRDKIIIVNNDSSNNQTSGGGVNMSGGNNKPLVSNNNGKSEIKKLALLNLK